MEYFKNFTNVCVYVLCVVAANYSFAIMPTWQFGDAMVPTATFVVGITFVARDFAQRSAGHWVLVAMAVALVISYFLADPKVAMASALAFAISELVDWAVYSFTKKPFYSRVLLSSVLSAPIDSAVFLTYIGFGSWQAILIHATFKVAVALAYYVGFKVWQTKSVAVGAVAKPEAAE